LLFFHMAIKTEFRLTLYHSILRLTRKRVAVSTVVSSNRSMHVLLISHPLVARVAGIVLVSNISYLFLGRLHIVAGDTILLGIRPMQGGAPELLGNIRGVRGVVNLRLKAFEFLFFDKRVDKKQILPFVPERLQDKKIPERPPV